jgi:ABC-type multidrug transport system fused ATPase/permease subunit
VITIAHRLNTILKSDKVLVLDMGKRIEYDDPNVLRNDPNSSFAALLKEIKKKK